MSGTLLEETRVAGNLSALWRLHRGTFLDASGNGHTLSVTGTVEDATCQKGPTRFVPRIAGAHYLSPGNPAALQLNTCTFFVLAHRNAGGGATFQSLLSKHFAVGMYYNAAAEPRALVSYDFSAAATRTSAFTAGIDTLPRLYACSYQNGVVNGSAWYVNGLSVGTFTITKLNDTGLWYLGFTDNVGSGCGYSVAGIINRVLTPAEHARLYVELWREIVPMGLPRRNFVYKYPAKNNTEYAAAGIVLDSDLGSEMAGTTRRIKDLAGSYPGTITGVVIPGQNGEGEVYNGSSHSHGDVTQLNNAAKASVELVVKATEAVITNGSTLFDKDSGGFTRFRLATINAAAVTGLYLEIQNGANTQAWKNTLCLRSGQFQHLLASFDGTQPTDTLKARLFVDGELITFDTVNGPFPATLANNVGQPLQYATAFGLPFRHEGKMERVTVGQSLTPDQAREAYMNSFAKRLVLRETLEDVPVSLVASVGAGYPLGGFVVAGGTYKISEAASGKRYLEAVTTGAAGCLQPSAFGTWVFACYLAAGTQYLNFIASANAPMATAGLNGYMLYANAGTGVLALYRMTNGASAATILETAAGYVAAGVEYTFVIHRRPSDGHFMLWIKGGAYVDWTLVRASVGSNPGADITYTSSQYFNATLNAGSKILGCDPADPTAGPHVWQGQLIPTMGEIPGSTLQNMLRWSEQFDNPVWTSPDVTVTPNAAASPFGTSSSADLLIGQVGSPDVLAQTIAGVNGGATYTFSCYARPSVGNDFGVQMSDLATGTCIARFNSTTGALTSLTASTYGNVSAGSDPIGGGWYRYWITGTQPANQTNLQVGTTFAAAGVEAYAWGAQLVQGPCAGRYVERQ